MQKEHITAHTKKKHKMNRQRIIISVVAVLLSLCALTAGMLVAKYFDRKTSDGLVKAKNFYFTSNLLDGEKHTLAPGSTGVTFTLGNHEDGLRYSEVDIEYTVTLSDGTNIKNVNTGTLTNGSVQDKPVTLKDLTPGKTYTVTAVGTGGYSKTLTATIIVPGTSPDLYYSADTSAGEYILLTVWNEGDKEGSATVIYTGVPDNTDPTMVRWKTNGKNNVTVPAHGSVVLRFFGGTVSVEGALEKELY